MKFGIFIFTLIFITNVDAQDFQHPLIKEFPSAVLFKSGGKQFDTVPLVGGPIHYQAGEGEGYLASIKLEVQGESSYFIHDYSKNRTSFHLFTEVMKRLQEYKFEVIYQCSGLTCGDMEAWQLYLSSYLSGNENAQYYFLAKQLGVDNNEWYLQFHVVDLDSEPRSYLRIINSANRPKLKFLFNQNLLSVNVKNKTAELDSIPNILFDVNKAQLNDVASEYLTILKDDIVSSEVKQLVVSGHTDNTGSRRYNAELAQQRADVVVAALQQFEELKGVEIRVKSFGETQPVTDNVSEEGRKKNRRVSIQLQNDSNS